MGRPAIDITGQRFGRVVVVERVGYADNNAKWKCVCDCGKEFISVGTRLRRGIKSCGCLNYEELSARKMKHGLSHTRLYRTWSDMNRRCHDSDYGHRYADYGGRGISVCDEWRESFEVFSEWANANGYRDDLCIDRIENSLGYSPNNCRWITRKENNNNKTNHVMVEYCGEMLNLAQLADRIGIKYKTLHNRYRKGWRGEQLIKEVVL